MDFPAGLIASEGNRGFSGPKSCDSTVSGEFTSESGLREIHLIATGGVQREAGRVAGNGIKLVLVKNHESVGWNPGGWRSSDSVLLQIVFAIAQIPSADIDLRASEVAQF